MKTRHTHDRMKKPSLAYARERDGMGVWCTRAREGVYFFIELDVPYTVFYSFSSHNLSLFGTTSLITIISLRECLFQIWTCLNQDERTLEPSSQLIVFLCTPTSNLKTLHSRDHLSSIERIELPALWSEMGPHHGPGSHGERAGRGSFFLNFFSCLSSFLSFQVSFKFHLLRLWASFELWISNLKL